MIARIREIWDLRQKFDYMSNEEDKIYHVYNWNFIHLKCKNKSEEN